MITDNTQYNTASAHPLTPLRAVILGLLTVAFGTMSVLGIGTLFSFMAAASAFALLIIAEQSFLAYIPVPATYLVAVLITDAPVTALFSLLFVPVAFIFRVCFAKKCSLSVTVVAATVGVAGVAVCAVLPDLLHLKAEYGSISAGLTFVKTTFETYVDSAFAQMNGIFKAAGQKDLSFTEQMISAVKESLIMISPSFFIVFCEITAYVTEKLIHLYTNIFSCREIYAGYPMRITLNVPSAIIFLASNFISLFLTSEIVYYSAENLMMMFLPLCTIAGIHSVFGKDGPFRRKGGGFTKILVIILCVMAFTMSPVMLFILLAVWGSVNTISRAVIMRLMNKGDGEGE